MAHGFAGTPMTVRPWADHLVAAGHAVSLPLLPGHGTRWEDLEMTRWSDWYQALETAFTDLRNSCDEVFGFGFSMGGALTLHLAAQHPGALSGVVLVNPSVGTRKIGPRVLSRVPAIARVKRTSHGIGGDIKKPGGTTTSYDPLPVRAAYQLTRLWRTVRRELADVTTPTLVYRSRVDHVVDERSAELLRAGLRNTELQERILENSYHVATLDHDAPEIFAGSLAWIRAHSRTGRHG